MTPPNDTSRSGTAWTEHQARQSARALLATVPITDPDLKLLRFGNNAVFKVGQRYVIRVARPDTPLDHIKQEVRVATALAEQGVPVVHLAAFATAQPLMANGVYGTLWDYLSGSGQATHEQFGSLLRSFHEQTNSLEIQLPDWQSLLSARRRLDVLSKQYPPGDIDLLGLLGDVNCES